MPGVLGYAQPAGLFHPDWGNWVTPGAPIGLKGLLAKQFDPKELRYQAGSNALLQAGLALMNPDPHAPPQGLLGMIGRGFAGAAQGAEAGKENFYNEGMRNVQLSELQRQQDERDQEKEEIKKILPTLPPDIQGFARVHPGAFMTAYTNAKITAQFTGKDSYTLGQDQVRYGPDNKPVAYGPSSTAAGGLFDGKSIEGQALNYLIQNNALTKDQAAQIAAGKPITGADGSMLFLTPQDIVNAAKQRQGQTPPLGGNAAPPNTSQFDLMTQPPGLGGAVQQFGIPLGPEKKTESQIKGEAIESGSSVAAHHLTAGATPDNPAPGADAAGTAWNTTMQMWPSVGRWFMTGEGQASYDDLFNIAQNYTYALSGQQAPEQEVQRNLNLILPSAKDKPEAVAAKKQRLIGFINTIVSRAKGPGGSAQPIPPPQQSAPNGLGGAVQEGATATNPQTGQKAIFRNGQWIMQ